MYVIFWVTYHIVPESYQKYFHNPIFQTSRFTKNTNLGNLMTVVQFILCNSSSFAFLCQQIRKNGFEDCVVGHRPLPFFVADLISHCSKPDSLFPLNIMQIISQGYHSVVKSWKVVPSLKKQNKLK